MSDANRDLVNLMIEEIQNRKNIELIDKIFSEDFLNHTPLQDIPNDRSGMRQLFSMTHVAFPDGVLVVEDQASSESKVLDPEVIFRNPHRSAQRHSSYRKQSYL